MRRRIERACACEKVFYKEVEERRHLQRNERGGVLVKRGGKEDR